jgi:hypothetical protein
VICLTEDAAGALSRVKQLVGSRVPPVNVDGNDERELEKTRQCPVAYSGGGDLPTVAALEKQKSELVHRDNI